MSQNFFSFSVQEILDKREVRCYSIYSFKKGKRTMAGKSIYRYSLKREKVLEIKDNTYGNSPEDIADFMLTLELHDAEQEHLIAVMLDTKNRIKGYYIIGIGLIDRCQTHAREVFRQAIIQGASRIVLGHNHPSGDPTPSIEDTAMTIKLQQVGKLIGIEVVDHVVLGEKTDRRPRGLFSMREQQSIDFDRKCVIN